ncbi:hypothetical protein GE061_000207 [Apolygus lucorum]|uniref:Uncharacterized protein n=1 Tax=Apolygus lucorum TaxID=248454 RepID=A0A6A4KMK5_APOLU|nr:hypothetical protein GE061_000207 [Apolygus lucorum]
MSSGSSTESLNLVAGKRERSPEESPRASKRVQADMGDEVGRMSLRDLMEEFGKLIDGKNLATKSDVEDIAKKVELVASKNEELENKITKLSQKNEALEAHITRLEDRSRRSNLIFKNITKSPNMDPKQTVFAFCREVLQLSEENISIIYATYLVKGANFSLILAEFADPRDVSIILKGSVRLKGTDYSVQQDYSDATRKVRAELFKAKKAILIKNKDLKMSVFRDTLWVNNERFFWDAIGGKLRGRNAAMAESLNALLPTQDQIESDS